MVTPEKRSKQVHVTCVAISYETTNKNEKCTRNIEQNSFRSTVREIGGYGCIPKLRGRRYFGTLPIVFILFIRQGGKQT